MAGDVQTCTRCSDNFIVNAKSIECDFCRNKFHLVCVKLKDPWLKVINECSNLFWFCDECKEKIKVRMNEASIIDRLQETSDMIVKTTERLLSVQQQKLPQGDGDQGLWSDIVKRNKNPALVIKPKTNQDSNKTKSAIAQKINPAELALSVESIKQSAQGSVIIKCNDKNSLEKLQNKAITELANNYDISIPKSIKPKICIVGVKEEHLSSEEDFISNMKIQNFGNCDINEFKLIKKYIPKNKNRYNVILELSPEQFKIAMSKSKIFIGWDSCFFFEYVSILRCYKCWKFGHKFQNCRIETIICPLCSEHHSKSECKSNKQVCTNCKHAHDVLKVPNITFEHTVFDKNCLSYKRAVDQCKQKIEYAI